MWLALLQRLSVEQGCKARTAHLRPLLSGPCPSSPLPPSNTGTLTLPDGTTQQLLTPAEAALVQRFDPSAELDTIGFFISKFRKRPAC